MAIDLYTGLHGWAEGLIASGWHVVGFDLHDMSRLLGEPLPDEHFALVIQDVLTLHGRQFKDAQLIVGSSPCQEFSYRAMPWKRAKALGPPELGMKLFEAQFRIQREASEAVGRHIPMVVENVRGAQPWVGRARWNAGSMYLWGDVPALMPAHRVVKVASLDWSRHGEPGYKAQGFNVVAAQRERQRWFNDGPRTADSLASSSSRSDSRRAASARIAKIPAAIAEWIGRAWFPIDEREAA